MESGVLEDDGVLRELDRIRSTGVAVGLTTTGPRQAETIRQAPRLSLDGVNPFSVLQTTWNLLEPSAGPAMAEAHAGGGE